MKYNLYIFLIFLVCCSKQSESPKDKNLIHFKCVFLAEMGDEEFDNLQTKTSSNIEAKYIDDLIIVTKYVEANACGNYSGNLEIKKDSIFLIFKLISDEVCSSTSIEKVTYIINNPKEKKYKFEMKYE